MSIAESTYSRIPLSELQAHALSQLDLHQQRTTLDGRYLEPTEGDRLTRTYDLVIDPCIRVWYSKRQEDLEKQEETSQSDPPAVTDVQEQAPTPWGTRIVIIWDEGRNPYRTRFSGLSSNARRVTHGTRSYRGFHKISTKTYESHAKPDIRAHLSLLDMLRNVTSPSIPVSSWPRKTISWH
ncbi:uncharacterized protein ARMOST_12517 [Armillaria ostoyae]|uniref:Uncharacterized protein n=1 Tax=Armillaria ostoyae TaxID=47428 RepID=A0A284RK56_ARMOS|nr:uncharacterized protein ARMOST_12517 [Armillaria ostoyae]